jgi:THO complex subunit 1
VAPNGPAFAAALDRLLTREVHWLQWKANGCPAFDRVAADKSVDAGAPVAGGKRKRAGPASRAKRLQLGNSELSRLWNLGDNSLTAIAAEGNKQAVPTLAEYLQPLILQVRL